MSTPEERRKFTIELFGKILLDFYKETILPAYEEGIIEGNEYKGFLLPPSENFKKDFKSDYYPVTNLMNDDNFGPENPLKLSCLSLCAEVGHFEPIIDFLASVKQDIGHKRIEESIKNGSCPAEAECEYEDYNERREDPHYDLKHTLELKSNSFLTDNLYEDYYKIGDMWASGASGTVCLAIDKNNRLVALKRIDNLFTYTDQYISAIDKYKKNFNSHPNLVSVYDIGADYIEVTRDFAIPFIFYTMEAADNVFEGLNKNIQSENGLYSYQPCTLKNVIKHSGIAPNELITILRELLKGIKTLHDAGFAHRDIKPDNIIFVGGIPVLADICLVCEYERTMSLIGTPGFIPGEYMEQMSNISSPDNRLDLYALGMTAYCALTGNSPKSFPSGMSKLMKEEGGKKIYKIINKACAKNPDERFQSADEIIEILEE